MLTAAAAATGIAACLIFQAFLPADDAMRTTLADPGVLRASPGPACTSRFWACSASGSAPSSAPSAGAIAVLFGALFVPTLLVALRPSSWQDAADPYLPMNAGDTIYTVRHEAHMLQPWAGSARSACTRRQPWPPVSS